MYNDTIKVENKIISTEDLIEIFEKIKKAIDENSEICNRETAQNEGLETSLKHWTTKDFRASFKCDYDFYDATTHTVDNYDQFIDIFNNRLGEIKRFWVTVGFSYNYGQGYGEYVHQSIQLYITETKMEITTNLSSSDGRFNDIYELIKEKILNAPEKYDRIIKSRGYIKTKIGTIIGIIPSLILCALLAIIPMVRELYGMTYVLYPLAVIVVGFLIGTTLFTSTLDRYYAPMIPEKKYAGYDSYQRKSVYVDNVDDYIKSSEIIIGHNINNLTNREKIKELEEKYNKYIPYEVIILIAASVIMVVIGKLFI